MATRRSSRLKFRKGPWLLAAVFLVVGAGILGLTSDLYNNLFGYPSSPVSVQLVGTTPGDEDKDCADFATQPEAQAFFDANGPANDPHRLDADNDNIPCEALIDGNLGVQEQEKGYEVGAIERENEDVPPVAPEDLDLQEKFNAPDDSTVNQK